mgnify:CR=1 FL=1
MIDMIISGTTIIRIKSIKPFPKSEYHFVVSFIQVTSIGFSGVFPISCITTPRITPIIVPIIVLTEKLTFCFFKKYIRTKSKINTARNVNDSGELIIKKLVKKEFSIVI